MANSSCSLDSGGSTRLHGDDFDTSSIVHYEDSYQPVDPTEPAHNSSRQSLTLPVLSSQVVPAGCSHGEVIYMDMREAGIASWSTWIMVGNPFLRVPLLLENWQFLVTKQLNFGRLIFSCHIG